MIKKTTALGIMNGTSLDGIDYALIEASADLKTLKFKKHAQFQIPKSLKEKLLKAARNKITTYDLSELHFDLGRLYEKHLKALTAKKWNWQIVGLHGQTVHHKGKSASLQIGHPVFLNKIKNKPVYFDFRSADIAMGGQGAPFAPFFQNHLRPSKDTTVAFHNLGGISNLTLFHGKKISAFDTGPANILMDAWVQKNDRGSFDKNGKFAALGLPNPLCVNDLLLHPFFKKTAPKSTGREDFNLDFINKFGGKGFKALCFNDQVATLTELSALSIAKSYKKIKTLPQSIYFYGGGILNPTLMERIQFYLTDIEIKTTNELGWPPQAFEASTFAFLAAARHFDKLVHEPQVTGAKKKVSLGHVYF